MRRPLPRWTPCGRASSSARALVTSNLPATMREGDRCTLRLSTGDLIDGRIVFFVPGRQLVSRPRRSGMASSVSRWIARPVESMVQLWITSWTRPAEEIAALAARLRTALDRALAEM